LLLLQGITGKVFQKNLYNYLKTIKLPKYGIWAMTKNKEPDLFIKELINVFQKIVTMPIESENSSETATKLNKIAIKNKINSEIAYNFTDALKKISSKEKKLIVPILKKP